jgi:hypothetical protein
MQNVGLLITWYVVINLSKYMAPFFRVKAKTDKVSLSNTLVTTYQ